MLRIFAQAAGIVALLAGPALAQTPDTAPSTGIPLSVERPPTPEEIEKRKAAERDYNAAMQKIPDRKGSSDPWGDVRPAAAASATPKKKQQPQPQAQQQ